MASRTKTKLLSESYKFTAIDYHYGYRL